MSWKSSMQALDASAIIYGWDNYPIEQFSSVWKWLGKQIEVNEVVICKVAWEEVEKNSTECAKWLLKTKIAKLNVDNAALAIALNIKNQLGIVNDKYHARGVGENDILIVATAKVAGAGIVSNEAFQLVAPDVPAKMKIPRVCDLPGLNVPCQSFLAFLKASKQQF
jgi:predicted nucleic acid-binding protein